MYVFLYCGLRLIRTSLPSFTYRIWRNNFRTSKFNLKIYPPAVGSRQVFTDTPTMPLVMADFRDYHCFLKLLAFWVARYHYRVIYITALQPRRNCWLESEVGGTNGNFNPFPFGSSFSALGFLG